MRPSPPRPRAPVFLRPQIWTHGAWHTRAYARACARASLSARACASVHVCANGCVSVCSRPTRKTFRRCPWALPHRSHLSPIPLRIARKSGPYDLPCWSVCNAENVITRRSPTTSRRCDLKLTPTHMFSPRTATARAAPQRRARRAPRHKGLRRADDGRTPGFRPRRSLGLSRQRESIKRLPACERLHPIQEKSRFDDLFGLRGGPGPRY